MCGRCQAARGQGPDQLEAAYHPGHPYLHWTCALCSYQVFWGRELEAHTARQHPGWTRRVRGPATVPAPAAPGRLPPVGRSGLGRLIVAGRVLLVAVVGDLQDLDEAEAGAEAAKGRVQLRIDRGHAAMMPAGSVSRWCAGWR